MSAKWKTQLQCILVLKHNDNIPKSLSHILSKYPCFLNPIISSKDCGEGPAICSTESPRLDYKLTDCKSRSKTKGSEITQGSAWTEQHQPQITAQLLILCRAEHTVEKRSSTFPWESQYVHEQHAPQARQPHSNCTAREGGLPWLSLNMGRSGFTAHLSLPLKSASETGIPENGTCRWSSPDTHKSRASE